ncbi:MAG: DUF4097 family beta strand repeat-containing protein [Caldisericia bacterium]
MKEEMIKKIEKLFLEGKITEEVKEKLIKEIEDMDEKKYEEKLKGSFKNIEIELISEDLEIKGSEDINEIVFEKGKDSVEIDESDDKLIIKSKNRGVHINVFGFKIGDEITTENLKIVVPSNSNVIVNDITGDIEVKNIKGNLKIKTVSGDIELKDIQGDVDCYTLSGDISIENLNGNFKINSKSGDIFANDIEDGGIIKTYSGDIRIKYGNFERLLLSTFSGDQRLENIKINDLMEIHTISGDINLSILTKDLKIEVDTKSGEGSIEHEGKITKVNKGEVKIGEGDKILRIKTLSGDINIDID